LSADTVNAFLAQMVEPVQRTEVLPLFDAFERVLAEDVVSPVSVPPHDNSAMDGYAFDGAQLQPGQTLTLQPVHGTAFAGKAWQGEVVQGQCVRIMTGAIMPAGLNTVVPQELVQTTASGSITIAPGLLALGDNRRFMGEDLMQGQPALRKGQRLTPAALGLVASLGLPTVTVYRRLRVAYFSTGDEILSLGDAPREGAVYDSNRYTVFGLLKRLGCEVLDLGVVGDDPAQLEATFRAAATQADAIITSGGVSVGEADHTKPMMKKLAGDDPASGGGVAFWRIAMRPGRPMAVGRIQKNASSALLAKQVSYQNELKTAVLFGLPGNPVAVMVTFLAFVRPALQRMMGCSAPPPVLLKARSTQTLRKKPGRTEYQRGCVTTRSDGSLWVEVAGNQGSGVLRSMVEANGLIVLHHSQSSVTAGDEVDVMVFDGVM
jgi:molybdopterin molybdotransferase